MTKFGLKRVDLLHALDTVSKVLPSTSSSPILNNFWVRLSDNKLIVSATDKSVTMTTSIASFTAVEDGCALFPAKETLEAVRKSSGDFILVSYEDSVLTLGSKNTKWKFPTKNIETYPVPVSLKESEIHTLNRVNFITALNSVKKAMAVNFKPSLTQIGIKGGKVTAADGIWFQECNFPEAPDLDIAIPQAVVQDLITMMSGAECDTVDVGLSKDSDSMVFATDDDVLTTHTMVLDFPDVSQSFMVPAMANKQVLKVSRKDLEACLARVRIAADSHTMAIKFHLSLKDLGEMEVSSKSKTGAECAEKIAVHWTGGDRLVVFHHEYLTRMLSSFVSADVEMRFGEDEKSRPSPVLIQDEDRAGVLNQLRADLI